MSSLLSHNGTDIEEDNKGWSMEEPSHICLNPNAVGTPGIWNAEC